MTLPISEGNALTVTPPPLPIQPLRLPGPTADDMRKATRRSKLWELDSKHHCPVIGTCLPLEELARFARRFFCLIDPRDEYAMHVEAVSHASSRNSISEAIHKHLERKYQVQIARFERAKTDADVLAAWREHCARGEVAGALWAAVTHKALGAANQQRIFADVHMLSHQLGAGQAADARRLAHLESELQHARAAQEKEKKRHADSEAALRARLREIEDERDRLRPYREENAKLRERLSAFESGSAMMEMGRKLLNLQAANDELVLNVQHMWSLEKTLKAAHAEAQRLARERDQAVAERNALERLLLAGDVTAEEEDEEEEKEACSGQCSSCDLATRRQCVLYVGGRTSLLAKYRALAERLGIRLTHHDGGLEESLSRLPDLISGADAVLCPTDCVSHSAYYQLKRQCKRSGKPCLLFKGASVSGFAVALARLMAGPATTSLNAV
jgi:hypothetical protein